MTRFPYRKRPFTNTTRRLCEEDIVVGIVVCPLAFAAAYFLVRRKSLGVGLCAVLSTGYVYGLFRAHFLDTFSYFLFDSALIGLYVACLPRFRKAPMSGDAQRLTSSVFYRRPSAFMGAPTGKNYDVRKGHRAIRTAECMPTQSDLISEAQPRFIFHARDDTKSKVAQ